MAIWPMVAIRVTGAVLYIAGLLVIPSLYSTAAWSAQQVGILLASLGLFIFSGIPAALVAVGDPWAAATRRMLAQRYRHPLLGCLAQLWAEVLWLGWLGWVNLMPFHEGFSLFLGITLTLWLASFGPLIAMLRFDRR